MAFKDVWKKITGKSESVSVTEKGDADIIPFASEAFPVVKLQEERLSAYKKVPLTSLSALGAVFSKIPEDVRTVVKTVTKNIESNEKLYIGINPKGVLGDLQRGRYGINGNIMQFNSQGKNVIKGRMQFKEYKNVPVNETTTTTLPMDPTVMVVAVALMSLEKKLDGIQKSVEEVFQFLKQEKQSKQRGNLNMLAEILDDYKLNCKNEAFCTSRINAILSIKTSAYQDIDFYQNQIATELQKQKGLHGLKDAQSVLEGVTYQFAEYQLACHLFAFSTFLDVLLQKKLDSLLIENVTSKMFTMVERYERLYRDCYDQIVNYQRSAIETKILGGIGVAVKGLGKAIGAVPILKEGTVDEALINMGDSVGKHNHESVEKKMKGFESFETNRMTPFVENLQSVGMLYNTENAMLTDGEFLYLIQ